MTRAIGLYGGSFDPFHLGHLNLAIEMLERANLDEVWLCPAQISPHKLQQRPISNHHRLKMLELATAEIPALKIVTLELERPAPSYTIDTIEALLATLPSSDHLHLIIGEDAAHNFSRWHCAEKLLNLVPVLVGCRQLETAPQASKQELLAQMKRIETPLFDISSSILRKRLGAKQFCGHLLCEKVLAYIYAHRLYC